MLCNTSHSFILFSLIPAVKINYLAYKCYKVGYEYSFVEPQRWSSANFQKVYFLAPIDAQTKHFKHHVRSKSGQDHQGSSRANFQKSVFISFYAQKRHFWYVRSKPGQSHQRSSSANFQKSLFFSSCAHERHSFLESWEVKIRLRSLRSSSAIFQKCIFWVPLLRIEYHHLKK